MLDMEQYLPDVLRDVREFRAITTVESPAFAGYRAAISRALDNQFVATADNDGLMRYEKMLGIVSNKTDTAADRRFRILAKINNRLPYSMGWLRRKLDTLFGAGNYQIIRDTAAHKLAVEADVQFETVIVSLYNDLRQSIPANMVLETYISSALPAGMYAGCWMQTLDEIYL